MVEGEKIEGGKTNVKGYLKGHIQAYSCRSFLSSTPEQDKKSK